MADSIVNMLCPACDGVGTITIHSLNTEGQTVENVITCPRCGGAEVMSWGKVDISDIMNKLDDIKQKLDETKEVCDDIWDKVNV